MSAGDRQHDRAMRTGVPSTIAPLCPVAAVADPRKKCCG